MIYFFLLSSLRSEHYEAVGITDRKQYGALSDEEKMAVIANLNARTKAIIRRDFLIAHFKDASRTNAISGLLFAFAKKHMPEGLAAIESQYNEEYEKRHKRLDERIAQLMPAQQPEEEPEAPDTPEAAEPEEAVADAPETDTPDETEAISTDIDGDMPQEMDNGNEEAAA